MHLGYTPESIFLTQVMGDLKLYIRAASCFKLYDFKTSSFVQDYSTEGFELQQLGYAIKGLQSPSFSLLIYSSKKFINTNCIHKMYKKWV